MREISTGRLSRGPLSRVGFGLPGLLESCRRGVGVAPSEFYQQNGPTKIDNGRWELALEEISQHYKMCNKENGDVVERCAVPTEVEPAVRFSSRRWSLAPVA